MDEEQLKQIKQEFEKLEKKFKQVNKLVIKSLILNLIVILLESCCIYNLFVIKNNGYKFFSKSFCIICLIFASIIGLRSIQYVIQNLKQLLDIYLMRYYIKNILNK